MKELIENAVAQLVSEAKKKSTFLYTQDCPHCDHRYDVHTHTKDADDCPECGEDVDDDEHKKCTGCPHAEHEEQVSSPDGQPLEEGQLPDEKSYHFARIARHIHEAEGPEGNKHNAFDAGQHYGIMHEKYGGKVADDAVEHAYMLHKGGSHNKAEAKRIRDHHGIDAKVYNYHQPHDHMKVKE